MRSCKVVRGVSTRRRWAARVCVLGGISGCRSSATSRVRRRGGGFRGGSRILLSLAGFPGPGRDRGDGRPHWTPVTGGGLGGLRRRRERRPTKGYHSDATLVALEQIWGSQLRMGARNWVPRCWQAKKTAETAAQKALYGNRPVYSWRPMSSCPATPRGAVERPCRPPVRDQGVVGTRVLLSGRGHEGRVVQT